MRRLRIGGRLPKRVILGEGRFDQCSDCTEHWFCLSVMVLRHVYNFMHITRVLRSIPPIETLSPDKPCNRDLRGSSTLRAAGARRSARTFAASGYGDSDLDIWGATHHRVPWRNSVWIRLMVRWGDWEALKLRNRHMDLGHLEVLGKLRCSSRASSKSSFN